MVVFSTLLKTINYNSGQIMDTYPTKHARAFQQLYQMYHRQEEAFRTAFIKLYSFRQADPHFVQHYFDLLEHYRRQPPSDLRAMLNTLFGRQPLRPLSPSHFAQFSYMANLLNPQHPVFSKALAGLLGFRPPVQSRSNHRLRVQLYLEFYKSLTGLYLKLQHDKQLYPLLKAIGILLKSEGIYLHTAKKFDLLMQHVAVLHQEGKLI
ncbi:MAG: hypothetical protein D6730_12215 [Bacteroidetes bacterium]|nr:MAG: hypothetical protein D6730_12215 [Bacteroidota bacterium]